MEERAARHDTDELLSQSFNIWRRNYRRKRTAAEIQEYFKHQEWRVKKARNLYLLSKAFSHWVQCTYEERLRVSQTRRKLLGLKYFSAWLEITTVKLLEVQRFQLCKVFKVWQSKAGHFDSQDTQACIHKDKFSIKVLYWHWFWKFCENRAPEWRKIRLKRKFFLQWRLKQQQLSTREQSILYQRNLEVAKKHLLLWLASTRKFSHNGCLAVAFNHGKLCGRTMSMWRHKTKHAPLLRQVAGMVDWRVVGTTFATVLFRFRMERQADLVKQMRLKRNAWTNWNDLLRQQILAKSMDDRILIEALYRWVLYQRCLLLHRLHQQKTKKQAFLRWRDGWNTAQSLRNSAADTVEAARKRSRVSAVFVHWRSKLNQNHQDEQVAFEFGASRFAAEALETWKAHSRHLELLNHYANRAPFYFLAVRLVKKQWKRAMLESKRFKRRNAYGQLRRTTKVHLARDFLHRWREKTSVIQKAKEEACFQDERRSLRLAAGLFGSWQGQTGAMETQNHRAKLHHRDHISATVFRVCIERLKLQAWRSNLALVHDNMRISDTALSCLHRLRLRMINLHGREPNALSLKKYHERRRLHIVFRAWQEKTVNCRQRPLFSRDPRLEQRHKAQ